MLNFSRRTPTLWKCFRWDSQKVGKIAHLGIFRHIGGSGVTEKLLTSKTSNIAISGPPRAEKWVFQTKHWHVRTIVHPNIWLKCHLNIRSAKMGVVFWQSCKISTLLHKPESSKQILSREKRVNHDILLIFGPPSVRGWSLSYLQGFWGCWKVLRRERRFLLPCHHFRQQSGLREGKRQKYAKS